MIMATCAHRREIARRAILAEPSRSTRSIAAGTGLSRELVQTTRRRMAAEGLVPAGGGVTGRDGKTYKKLPTSRKPSPLARRATAILGLASRMDGDEWRAGTAVERAMVAFAVARLGRAIGRLTG